MGQRHSTQNKMAILIIFENNKDNYEKLPESGKTCLNKGRV